jgi:ornithine carbamoyltransferase
MALPIRTASNGAAHLLSVADLGPGEIQQVLDDALALKAVQHAGAGRAGPLAGKHVALVFDKPSLRTRVSFEVGIHRLGGGTTTMSGADVGLGSREALPDIARTLGRYVDAIVVRMLSHAGLAELSAAADVPVVNALTGHEHPCQALADLLTLREHLGVLRRRQLAYVGDGNNVCHSLLLAAASVGVHVRVASPPGHEPDAEVVAQARLLARNSGARIEVGDDPASAVAGADAVYTDVWASMGQEAEAVERRRRFAGFRLTRALLRPAPNALVMHCLPAHRGDEIDADVIDGPNSVVFDQAENRMHVQQAVLLHLLRRGGGWMERPRSLLALGAPIRTAS